MDILISLVIVISSQHICTSKHDLVYLKYKILIVKYTKKKKQKKAESEGTVPSKRDPVAAVFVGNREKEGVYF